MKYDFEKMKCENNDVLFELVAWIDRNQLRRNVDDEQPVTVFVDSQFDFCAVEFARIRGQYTSRCHSLLECICSPYIPCVVSFGLFRRKVFDLAFLP